MRTCIHICSHVFLLLIFCWFMFARVGVILVHLPQIIFTIFSRFDVFSSLFLFCFVLFCFFSFFLPRYLSFTDDLTEIEFSWKESEQAFKHYKEKQVRNVEVCGGNNIIVDSSNCVHPQYSEFISVVARGVKIGRMQREISIPVTVVSGLHPVGNDLCIYMQLMG